MNLHGVVRTAINAINPDQAAYFYANTGPAGSASGKQTPTFAAPVPVRCQVQPLARGDLQHIERLNLQGVFRVVFMFGNTQGVVRVNQQGGDKLVFQQFQGQANSTWKVVYVDGPWNVENHGWTRLIVCLQ
jgi:hypothetical protein